MPAFEEFLVWFWLEEHKLGESARSRFMVRAIQDNHELVNNYE